MRYIPNGSTTRLMVTTVASITAAVSAAVQQYREAVDRAGEITARLLELKIDELRNLRHEHERDPEQAPDRHGPRHRQLPPHRHRPMRRLRRIGALRAHVVSQLLRIRREPGDGQKYDRDGERDGAVDRTVRHVKLGPEPRE